MNHSPETLEKIRQKALELFDANGYDATETQLGFKETNGVVTPQRCIRFGVVSKKPSNEIDPQKIIPKFFDIDGEQIYTDVYEIKGVNEAMPVYCNDSGRNGVVPMAPAPAPVSANRAYTRPLRGGVSAHASPKSGFVYAGTLGGVVVDALDGTIVGITNNHVGGVAGGADPLAGIPMTISSNSTYGAKASAYRSAATYSPSSWDRGIIDYAPDRLGTLKRAMPFKTVGNNVLDVALINLSNTLVDTSSWLPLSAPFNTAPAFATTAEINSLGLNDPVFRSGRTLGPVGNGACDIRIQSSSSSGSINYTYATIAFVDMLQFNSPTSNVFCSSGGDSGSLLYACVNSTNPATSAWRVIGLLHAGNATSNYGLGIRIDNVANMIGVSAYTGDARSANAPLSSSIVLPYSTYSNEVSAVIGGKTYWSFGRI
jgi:hypothetical protein